MKKKIYFILLAEAFAIILFTLVISSLTGGLSFRAYLSPSGWVGLLAICAFVGILSYFLADYLAEKSQFPLNIMISYIDKLMSGKLDSNDPYTEEERKIAEYLKFDEDKKKLLTRMMNIRKVENMRRQFSANVSHELKSPLTSINGYAEIIETGLPTPEDDIRFAKIIRQEGERLLTIIDETIQLSKFDADAIEDIREDLNFSDLIRQEKERLKHHERHRDVEIVLENDLQYQGGDIYYRANAYLMRIVVQNLISNAIKYSKPAGGKVWISLNKKNQELILTIRDQGIGISEEDQKHIFERFFVADPGRSRMTGASRTGLGLALVKHTVLSYNGTVNVHSRLGEGSTFEVILPYEQNNENELGDQ